MLVEGLPRSHLRPASPLSFHKSQTAPLQHSVTIQRQWDIESIWLGAKDLAAVRAPSDFL
ncbi:hypothetical protein BKA56DRAFT_599772 [Ilyonectria sp. MPI-CAGE-AT-0026]|nr:hypothetical protein BKA56DRAFT_599772 [Ilyonectria sp. MPI-CAGE-AT-0026]